MAHPARIRTLYEATEALPEGITGEIIHGHMHTQHRPFGPHALASSRVGMPLGAGYDLGSGDPGGWWIDGSLTSQRSWSPTWPAGAGEHLCRGGPGGRGPVPGGGLPGGGSVAAGIRWCP